MKPVTLTIDRAKWMRRDVELALCRAGRPQETLLLNEQGMMCCLGFYATACGLPPGAIRRREMPGDTSERWHRRGAWSRVLDKNGHNNGVANALIRANDADDLDSRERERRIRDLFHEIGVRVRFVGRTPRVTRRKGEG